MKTRYIIHVYNKDFKYLGKCWTYNMEDFFGMDHQVIAVYQGLGMEP